MDLASGGRRAGAGVVVAVLLAAAAVLWRLGYIGPDATSPIVSPAPAPAVAAAGPQIVAAYGMPIGYGEVAAQVIDPTTGDYRTVAGNLHTVSPDLRWAIMSVERVGELPQLFDFWLYDTVHGRRALHLGQLPYSHVRWSADGRWLSFARVKAANKQDHCADQVRFVEVETSRETKVALECDHDRVVPLGWTDAGLSFGTTVVRPTGEVVATPSTPAVYGPHPLAADSPADAGLRQLAGDGAQVFLAPAAALPAAAAARAVPAPDRF
ncbi:hypothetical protein AB0J74_13380 [Asanoa sp. NPDC049573]|uniref:hypothetical protein n=1 Tax=Asanoa sp. NPDC049573 TaxID=3155396 RepID=UPI00341A69DA